MAANEKFNDLGLDGLESETLLRDDTLSDADDLDNLDEFNLDSDMDLNLDDVLSDDDGALSDDLDNLDNLDYSAASDDAAVSDDAAEPIASDMADNDIVDYPDAIDTGDPTEAGDMLTDDELDLSLEAGLDDEPSEITPDISDDDIANFDSSDYSDGMSDDDDDDDDDDAYGVDLKIGPVTIAFTQVIEPPETVSDESDLGDFDNDEFSADELDDSALSDDMMSDDVNLDEFTADLDDDISDESEITEDDNLSEFETDLSDDGDIQNEDAGVDDELPDLSDEETILPDESDSEQVEEDTQDYDISSDEDIEFDVEQDEALNDIDIDDVLEENQDDSNVINIPMPHEDELVVDEDQDAFLSSETEDVMADFPTDTAISGDVDITETADVDETVDETDTGDDLSGFDETVLDLSTVGAGSDDNLISDADLDALEESAPVSEETDETDDELTEAVLAEDVVVDEELAAEIPSDDDERIALDGDEDLGIDMDNIADESADTAEEAFDAADAGIADMGDMSDISMDEDLPDTIEPAEETGIDEADEQNVITDEMPADIDIPDDDLSAESDGSVMDVDLDSIPTPTFTDEEDDDETIGLSGEELDNILVDAESEASDGDMMLAEPEEYVDMPTDEELAESINIPDDPGFENDDEYMSDEELAASVQLPGETAESDNTPVDNNIMTNGDLDLYENVDENGSIIPTEDDTRILDGDAQTDETLVVPASDDTLSDEVVPNDDADISMLETDTMEMADDSDESETIDLTSFEADLEPADGIDDIGLKPEETDESDDDKIGISEEETNEIYDSLQDQDQPANETDAKLRQDVKNVLSCLDSLMGALPEEKIKEFAESKEFEAYRRLIEQLEIKTN